MKAIAVVLVAAVTALPSGDQAAASGPTVRGLDHVPVAVSDLNAAAARYRALGFTLKPGRAHENGITNEHVKFRDGTEIELITAPRAVDDLTRTYRAHLAQGDGPAFLALFTPQGPPVESALNRALPYVFFGRRQASPTDRPEHFVHPNTADGLISVWLAGTDLSAERRLLTAVGATFRDEFVSVPAATRATVAHFPQGTVVLLPQRYELVPGRRIVGMTVRAGNRVQAARVLGSAVWSPPAGRRSSGAGIFVPPSSALGY